MTEKPIVVHATPTRPQIEAALRQVILAIGPVVGLFGYAGFADSHTMNTVLALIGPASAIISFVWGQWNTRKQAQKAATMAEALPDKIAQTK